MYFYKDIYWANHDPTVFTDLSAMASPLASSKPQETGLVEEMEHVIDIGEQPKGEKEKGNANYIFS